MKLFENTAWLIFILLVFCLTENGFTSEEGISNGSITGKLEMQYILTYRIYVQMVFNEPMITIRDTKADDIQIIIFCYIKEHQKSKAGNLSCRNNNAYCAKFKQSTYVESSIDKYDFQCSTNVTQSRMFSINLKFKEIRLDLSGRKFVKTIKRTSRDGIRLTYIHVKKFVFWTKTSDVVSNNLRWVHNNASYFMKGRIKMNYVLTQRIYLQLSSDDPIIIVKNTRVFNFKIFISSYIARYNNNSKIDYFFCKNNDRNCLKFKGGENVKAYFFGFDFQCKSTVEPLQNISITLKFKYLKKDLSGRYYLRAFDKTHYIGIKSNYIELRDVIYWRKHGLINPSVKIITKPNLVIDNKMLPYTFSCDYDKWINSKSPIWLKSEIRNSIKWTLCPVLDDNLEVNYYNNMELNKCVDFAYGSCYGVNINPKSCPTPIELSHNFNVAITGNGNLTIWDIAEDISKRTTYALLCYTKTEKSDRTPLSFIYGEKYKELSLIKKGIKFTHSNKDYEGKAKIIYPEKGKTVQLLAREKGKGNRTEDVYSLHVAYQISPLFRFEWKFNGKTLFNDHNFQKTSHRLEFIGDILPSMSGKYEFVVSDEDFSVNTWYNVVIVSPPTLKDSNCIPPVLYVTEGESANISCVYENSPTNLAVFVNDKLLYINRGIDCNLSNQVYMEYPYLSCLEFSITPTHYDGRAKTQKLEYYVKHLRKAYVHLKYQDHLVTFLAKNKYGTLIKSTSIIVVPRKLSN